MILRSKQVYTELRGLTLQVYDTKTKKKSASEYFLGSMVGSVEVLDFVLSILPLLSLESRGQPEKVKLPRWH